MAKKVRVLSKADVLRRVRGLSAEQQKAMVCALVGHSKIRDFCFGYHHCARCGALLGDSLGGAYQDDTAVYPTHLGQKIKGCHCAQNAKALTWRDTLYAPDPFAKSGRER